MNQSELGPEATVNAFASSETPSTSLACLFKLVSEPQYIVLNDLQWVTPEESGSRCWCQLNSHSDTCPFPELATALDTPARQATAALYLIDAAIENDAFVDLNLDETYTNYIAQVADLSRVQRLQLAIALLEKVLTTFSEMEVAA